MVRALRGSVHTQATHLTDAVPCLVLSSRWVYVPGGRRGRNEPRTIEAGNCSAHSCGGSAGRAGSHNKLALAERAHTACQCSRVNVVGVLISVERRACCSARL